MFPSTTTQAAAAVSKQLGWFPLPPKFGDPATSGVRCTVDSGRMTHDIELQ